ncbi:MAG: hypothetical protein PVH89_09355 [Gammaproteobacteria bacterium]|jgi:folate-binding protein YgfZ
MTDVRHSLRRELALVRVAGSDARQFLHAQTTQDIDRLGLNETRFAAWLSPKGRVQALFDVVPAGDSFWLITPADNADWLTERLRLFVLRADVQLEVVAEPVVHSLTGNTRAWLHDRAIDLGVGGVVHRDGLLWIRIGEAIVDAIGPSEQLAELFADIPAADSDVAIGQEIAAGRPALPAALRDRYIPQMLNLDLLDAISFTKGCYPGQEIVARTENLGQVKRRMYRFGVADGVKPVPGDAIVDDAARTAGEVVRSITRDGGFELLAVIQIDAAGRRLELASDGRALEQLPLESEG